MKKSPRADRRSAASINVTRWLAEPMPADVRKSVERIARADGVAHIAVMPDVHLSGDVCVGLVVATREWVYPQAVGGDIGCGMLAIAFDASADMLRDQRRAAVVLERLRDATPPMRHRSLAGAPPLPNQLDVGGLSDAALARFAQRDGRVELGTLGRGNHFIEFQADDDDRIWLMIHSGSRCVGQRISTWHLSRATHRRSGLAALRCDEPLGQAFLSDAAWASRYADANRRTMCEAVTRVLSDTFGVTPIAGSEIASDHNHVRREQHFGEQLWVHRKGATSAMLGEPAVIPGSMGTHSYHVLGRGCELALRSSSHGAGRLLSRTEASQLVTLRSLSEQMGGVHYDESIAARLREEAPIAYKDIDAVMRAQRDLTKIVRRLRPVLVYKAV